MEEPEGNGSGWVGRLYFSVKDINIAGHALHSGDLEAAAKYNLTVLYRRGKGKAATEVVVPGPAPTPAK